ncbi:MAG: FAD-dependent oxidoreductase [Solirubrobacteraceae bacterium]
MRVVVVGCGAVGAASALALARAGHDVTVLERFGPANAYGSSHGGARIFRCAYDEPDYTALALRAHAGWRQIEAAAGVELLTTTGCVDHGDPAALAGVAAAARVAGAASEPVSAGDAARRWPGLRFDGDAQLDPLGGRLDAAAAVSAMAWLAVAAGARLVTERAIEVDATGVTTGAGRHEADAVVVAAGAWTHGLVAGLPAPVITLEQPVHFAVTVPADWPSFIHHPAGDDPVIYGLLEPGAGLKVGEHGTGRVVDPDDLDRDPEPEGIERLRAYAARWLPGAQPASAVATGCLYDTTANNNPVIDRLPDGVIAAAGTSGHGFKFAPELGALVAGLVAGDAPHPRLAVPA